MALRRRRKRRKVQSHQETKQARRKRLYEQQGGICHSGWGCGTELPHSGLEEAHLSNLGMGASRDNPDDPRNAEGKTVLLCRGCHMNQEAMVRNMHAGWKSGLCDYIDPTANNVKEVLAEVDKHDIARIRGD